MPSRTLPIVALLGVIASACGSTPIEAPKCPEAPPPRILQRARSFGEKVLDATPPTLAWFEACRSESVTLVAQFDRLDRNEPLTQHQVTIYLDLLAKIFAMYVNARALDHPSTPQPPEQTRQEILRECHELLAQPLEMSRPRLHTMRLE
jgi:hypothetical protein